MKDKAIVLMISVLLALSSCFMGADSFEKDVNEYFFLHRESGAGKTYLGTIEEGGYRIANKYLGPIAQIGWNEQHIIARNKTGQYYIQPIVEGASLEQIQKELKGPLSREEFQAQRIESKVDESLEFDLEY